MSLTSMRNSNKIHSPTTFPDTVLHFPKLKAESSKNEIIHSFVLENTLWLITHAALSFWKVSPKTALSLDCIWELLLKAEQHFRKNQCTHPMHRSKVTSDRGPRVHGNSPASSSQHFLSHFCCCLGEMLKCTRLPLWLKPWCQQCPWHYFAQIQHNHYMNAFQLKSDSGSLLILIASNRSKISCSYRITYSRYRIKETLPA